MRAEDSPASILAYRTLTHLLADSPTRTDAGTSTRQTGVKAARLETRGGLVCERDSSSRLIILFQAGRDPKRGALPRSGVRL